METTYFRDIDGETLYSPVGVSGFGGIFRLQSNSDHWEFLSPGSIEWDRAHQKIYRAGRVEAIDPAQLPFLLPPLPELSHCDVSYKKWIDNLLPKHPIATLDYPLTKAFIEAQENRQITVFAVLTEDAYETLLGDGRFHYLAQVFLSKESAAKYIAHEQQEWVRFHLRTIAIGLDGEAFCFPSFEAREYDRHKAEDILRRLESLLGK